MTKEVKGAESHKRLRQHGTGGELFAIFIVNILLKLVTLGIYHFWAQTRVRRYLWTQASFDNERFEYKGRGVELFLGFLKALGLLILIGLSLVVLARGLAQIHESLSVVVLVGLYAVFFYSHGGRYIQGTPLYVEPNKLAQHPVCSGRFQLHVCRQDDRSYAAHAGDAWPVRPLHA